MKVVYALIFIALLQSNAAYCQKKEGTKKRLNTADYLGSNYTAQYNLAMQVKDYQSACSALYGLLAIHETDTNALFNLMTIYFQHGQNEQCFMLCKEYSPKFRDNVTLLDFYGKSAELLGRYTDALECYQKLYIITKHLYYGYQVANVENSLGRKAESMRHMDELLMDPYVATERITLYAEANSTSKGEDVSIKAALLNLKGNAFSDENNYVSARQCFLEALKLEPDFGMALAGYNKIKSK